MATSSPASPRARSTEPDGAARRLDAAEDPPSVREEGCSPFREAHATRRPHEEGRSQFVLQPTDLTADGRLGDVKLPSGTTDVPLFRYGDEIDDLGKAHAHQYTSARRTRPAVAAAGNLPDGARARSKRHWTPWAAAFIFARMSVEIHGPREIERLRKAGQAAASTLAFVGARLRPGVTTAAIDTWVREHTRSLGGRPSPLGHEGFPAAVCTSRNSVVCHGIPREDDVLQLGDIVNVDVTTELGGFHGDTSATFVIGESSAEARHVVDVALRCRDAGIEVIRDGARLGDIGAAIVELAGREGCSVVRDFGGHGIGREMHMDPHVPHFGVRGAGLRLRAGMTLTVEPMINLGRPDVRVLDDGWTVVTVDGSLSAQFEHTILVTREGFEILTRAPHSAAAPSIDGTRG